MENLELPEYRSIDGALRVSIALVDGGGYLVSETLSGVQTRTLPLDDHETATAWARTLVRQHNKHHGHGYILDDTETVVGGRVVQRARADFEAWTVRHRDGDPENNAVGNLEVVPATDE